MRYWCLSVAQPRVGTELVHDVAPGYSRLASNVLMRCLLPLPLSSTHPNPSNTPISTGLVLLHSYLVLWSGCSHIFLPTFSLSSSCCVRQNERKHRAPPIHLALDPQHARYSSSSSRGGTVTLADETKELAPACMMHACVRAADIRHRFHIDIPLSLSPVWLLTDPLT